jgi:hypothetical protein
MSLADPHADATFQQAKKPEAEAHFLPIVAEPDRPAGGKTRHKLTRVAFRVSRLMESAPCGSCRTRPGIRTTSGRWWCSRS